MMTTLCDLFFPHQAFCSCSPQYLAQKLVVSPEKYLIAWQQIDPLIWLGTNFIPDAWHNQKEAGLAVFQSIEI